MPQPPGDALVNGLYIGRDGRSGSPGFGLYITGPGALCGGRGDGWCCQQGEAVRAGCV